jgi:hypothetical protein
MMDLAIQLYSTWWNRSFFGSRPEKRSSLALALGASLTLASMRPARHPLIAMIDDEEAARVSI